MRWALVVMTSSACSVIGVHGSTTWSPDDNAPRCTPDSGLPVLDTAAAVTFAGIGFVTLVERNRRDSSPDHEPDLVDLAAPGLVVLSVPFALSAAYGYLRVSECSRYEHRTRARIEALREQTRDAALHGDCAQAARALQDVYSYDRLGADTLAHETSVAICVVTAEQDARARLDACQRQRADAMTSAKTAAPGERIKLLRSITDCGTPNDRFWQLARDAAIDAGTGRCDVVDATYRHAEALDSGLFHSVFETDPLIATCMEEPAASARRAAAATHDRDECVAKRARLQAQAEATSDPPTRARLFESMPSCEVEKDSVP